MLGACHLPSSCYRRADWSQPMRPAPCSGRQIASGFTPVIRNLLGKACQRSLLGVLRNDTPDVQIETDRAHRPGLLLRYEKPPLRLR